MGKAKGDQSGPRAKNFSPAEIEQLKTEVEQRKGILFASLSSTITFKTKELEWASLTEEVNKVGGHDRTVDQVKIKWQNISSSVKKVLAEKKKVLRLTGGGSGTEDLTPDEERIGSILGKERFEGICGGLDTSEGLRADSNNLTFFLSDTVPSPSSSPPPSSRSLALVPAGFVHDDDMEFTATTTSTVAFTATTTSSSTVADDNEGRTRAAAPDKPQPTKKRASASHYFTHKKKRRHDDDDGEDPQLTLVLLQREISKTLQEINGNLMANREKIREGFTSLTGQLNDLIEIQKDRLKVEEESLELKKQHYLVLD